MGRITTFVNGGGVKPSDLNSIQDDYEASFAGWKTLIARSGLIPAATVAGTYYLGANDANVAAVGAAVPSKWGFHFDPADVPASPRTVQYRLRMVIATNAVAPTATFTGKLMKAATFGGASGAEPNFATWTEQASLTGGVAVAAPAAQTETAVLSSAPAAVTAGAFFAAVTTSVATTVAGAVVLMRLQLQFRQV